MDASNDRLLAPFAFKLANLEQNLLVKSETQDRTTKYVLEFEVVLHLQNTVHEKEVLISSGQDPVILKLDSPVKKTKLGEHGEPENRVLKSNLILSNGDLRDSYRKSRGGSRDSPMEGLEVKKVDLQRLAVSLERKLNTVELPKVVILPTLNTPISDEVVECDSRESIDSMDDHIAEEAREIEHGLKTRHFDAFDDFDEISPRGHGDVTSINLQDSIEENENVLDILLGESLKNSPKSPKNCIKGWLMKAKGNTMNSNEIWEKRYVVYDITTHVLQVFQDKNTSPLSTTQLVPNNTFLFHGTQTIAKETRYVLQLSLGVEYLVFSADNLDDYYKWLFGFRDIQKGDLQLSGRKSSKEVLDIQYHEYTTWKVKQVKEWIKHTLFYFDEKYVAMIQEAAEVHKIVGPQLNGQFDLRKIFAFDKHIPKTILEEMQNELSLAISNLKMDKTFDRNKFVVAKKIYKAWPDQFKANRIHYLNLASNISSAKSLHNFLLMDYQSIRDQIDKVDKKENKKKLKVKLVITNTTYPHTYRKLLSPILNPLNIVNVNYGIFHSALIVGPYYLDWNASELCVPKRIMKSSESFFSTDISEIWIQNYDLEGVIKKISEVIALWNTVYTYGNIKIGNARNCQDFVEDIMRSLNIAWNPKPGGSIERFMNSLKNGNEGAKFFASDQFERFFSSNQYVSDRKNREFTTHEELDKFAAAIHDACTTIEADFPEEWNLLKSFDRGFWLKYYTETTKNPGSQSSARLSKVSPMRNYKCVCCPFGDPKVTGSFR